MLGKRDPEYRRKIRQQTEDKQRQADRERDETQEGERVERLLAAIGAIEQQNSDPIINAPAIGNATVFGSEVA